LNQNALSILDEEDMLALMSFESVERVPDCKDTNRS
jgi:hypothetical protein